MAQVYPDKALSHMYDLVQLLRKEVRNQFTDGKDADDWLFSKLNLTVPEIQEIYKNHPDEYPYTESAIQGSPRLNPNYDYLSQFIGQNLFCEQKTVNGKIMTMLVADIPGKPVLMTDTDCPAISQMQNEQLTVRKIPGLINSIDKPCVIAVYIKNTDDVLYAVEPESGNTPEEGGS